MAAAKVRRMSRMRPLYGTPTARGTIVHGSGIGRPQMPFTPATRAVGKKGDIFPQVLGQSADTGREYRQKGGCLMQRCRRLLVSLGWLAALLMAAGAPFKGN